MKYINKLKTELSFGKYKGHSIEEIISKNPSYIKWLNENIPSFSLDNAASDMLKEQLDKVPTKYYGYPLEEDDEPNGWNDIAEQFENYCDY